MLKITLFEKFLYVKSSLFNTVIARVLLDGTHPCKVWPFAGKNYWIAHMNITKMPAEAIIMIKCRAI